MKKYLPYLTILIIIAVIVILFLSMAKKEQMVASIENNHAKKAIKIIPGHFHDIECAMTIESEHFAAQAVSPSGKTWFFDDVGCLINWLEDKTFKDEAVLWIHAEDTEKWIDARKAWYTRTDPTPMHYGFGAREKAGKDLIDFETMRLLMLRGENLTDPRIRKKLLGI
ncbi:MAG: nitrous oxide reductase accessory protein NosL [Epsilonproteobacteria bacterium]|nr:nitrous oxide reductase accessory protein NosL [Campylobacterota bacterium]